MTVHELNREQLIQLKEAYLQEQDMRNNIEHGLRSDLDYATLAMADAVVSDETIYAYYADTTFTPDDFFEPAQM
jgi:hypothetical protein